MLDCKSGKLIFIDAVKDCQEDAYKRDPISTTSDLKVDVLKKCMVIKRSVW